MGEEEIKNVVLDALLSIAPELDPATLDPSRRFRDQCELDSVDYLNFILTVSARMGVTVPEMDYPRLSSLDGCVSYLSGRGPAGDGGQGGGEGTP
ncbi:acyl carrier protein [Haliangium sp.]|uniref:acyl carrier protein n=1 Tax=Haliangium sp. TaxID=2663208 RepID=UPI003D0A4005